MGKRTPCVFARNLLEGTHVPLPCHQNTVGQCPHATKIISNFISKTMFLTLLIAKILILMSDYAFVLGSPF